MDITPYSRAPHRIRGDRTNRAGNDSSNTQKNELSREADAGVFSGPKMRFVAAMEDVLEVYARPFNPLRPLVCLDEAAKQLLGEKRPPSATSEHPARYDNQYTRNGTCALFMLFQPLAALRHVLVKDRRTAVDYAQVVRYLV